MHGLRSDDIVRVRYRVRTKPIRAILACSDEHQQIELESPYHSLFAYLFDTKQQYNKTHSIAEVR